MSVCADVNITGTFPTFWTHEDHYQCKLRNFDDGGLLSWWSFVRDSPTLIISAQTTSIGGEGEMFVPISGLETPQATADVLTVDTQSL